MGSFRPGRYSIVGDISVIGQISGSDGVVGADTKPPSATWQAAGASLVFDTRPDQAISRKTMQDGNQYTFTGPLTWAITNGVGDLGYDHADSQGNDKWLYFYWVGSGTIVASDNPPSTGPVGHSNFICCSSAYIASDAIAWFVQVGNFFHREEYDFSLAAAVDVAPVQQLLSAVVPDTCAEVEIGAFIAVGGAHTTGVLQIWVDGQQAGRRTMLAYARQTEDTGAARCRVSTPTSPKALYYQRTANTALAGAGMFAYGYMDGAVEA